MKKSLLALFSFILISVSVFPADYTAFEDATTASFALPLYMSNSTGTS